MACVTTTIRAYYTEEPEKTLFHSYEVVKDLMKILLVVKDQFTKIACENREGNGHWMAIAEPSSFQCHHQHHCREILKIRSTRVDYVCVYRDQKNVQSHDRERSKTIFRSLNRPPPSAKAFLQAAASKKFNLSREPFLESAVRLRHGSATTAYTEGRPAPRERIYE